MNKKRASMQRVWLGVIPMLLLCGLGKGISQPSGRPVSVGFHFGGNVWLNALNVRKVGTEFEFMVRYQAEENFLIGVQGGYEELKSFGYPHLLDPYLRLSAIPLAGCFWYHINLESAVSPFVYSGVGVIVFERLNASKGSVGDSGYACLFQGIIGLGLEAFVFSERNFSLYLEGAVKLLDDRSDNIDRGGLEISPMIKVGLNYYIP